MSKRSNSQQETINTVVRLDKAFNKMRRQQMGKNKKNLSNEELLRQAIKLEKIAIILSMTALLVSLVVLVARVLLK